MIKIAPSILSADFSRLGEQIAAVERGGAHYLHIDVMDGCFVPNLTFGPVVIKSIRPHSRLFFDVHLMITEPERYLEDFARAGADSITVHMEAVEDLQCCIDRIHALGKRAGVAIKPATSPERLSDVLDKLDMVLVMSVEPGFGGQQYMDQADEKLRFLRQFAREGLDLSVDGGIKVDNLDRAVRSGANTLVAGSAIFAASDIAAQTRSFVQRANEVEAILQRK